MNTQRNSTTLILMFSSILLLLVLQFLWIKGSYSKALDDLKKETNSTFRSTIFAMRDTLFQQAYAQAMAGPDSTFSRDFRRPFDSLRFEEGIPPDHNGNHRRQGSIFVITPRDTRESEHSTNRGSRDEASHEFRERREFMFRLAPDSLKIDSISHHYDVAMTKSGTTLPFKILRFKRGEKRTVLANSFMSEPVRLNPFSRYAVVVTGIQGKLIRIILPQALFSIFLTLLTGFSFYVLYRSIRSQQKLVQLKNDFISNITHELKTPITTVSVAIEAIRNFQGVNNPALTEEYLGIAQNELGRLTLLTDKVLKTAIYEDQALAFTNAPVDLEKIITQVALSLKLVFEKSGATFNFIKTGDDFVVAGDVDHLVNVIYNLLDNAVKYSPAPAVLAIELEDEKDNVKIIVNDNGPGIAPEYRKKVFEKFFRVPTGDVHNIKGYGLGLSYVESVVRRHRGTIEVKSNGGTGSSFVITLPKRQNG